MVHIKKKILKKKCSQRCSLKSHLLGNCYLRTRLMGNLVHYTIQHRSWNNRKNCSVYFETLGKWYCVMFYNLLFSLQIMFLRCIDIDSHSPNLFILTDFWKIPHVLVYSPINENLGFFSNF